MREYRATNGPEQDRDRGEVVTPVAHPGSLPEDFKGLEQFLDPSVGRLGAVRGNVFPNFVQIRIRIDTENVAVHARVFRRSADLRCNRARARTGSTVSPRSRAARRRQEMA
jgi:hypothetical protein